MGDMTLRSHIVPTVNDAQNNDDDDDEGEGPVELRSVDPLAAEPLTNEEMLQIERYDPDIDEGMEYEMRAMSQGTEADMPIDVDAAEGIEPADDQKLGVRMRPRSKA